MVWRLRYVFSLYFQAVTRSELYGSLHPSTREWREGLVSVTFRDMSNNKSNKHQWIVLDGDIDAEWIEVLCLTPSSSSTLGNERNKRRFSIEGGDIHSIE